MALLDRRGILKFIVGGAVGISLTPLPWKLTDDISIWTQNWPWIPRNPKGPLSSSPSLVKLGGLEYGIQVMTVGGNPSTVSGNPDHPLSLGGIDPLAASSAQLLYSPARVQGPMKRDDQGRLVSISWEQGLKELTSALSRQRRSADSPALISGDETGSCNEILTSLLAELNSEACFLMPSDSCTQARVWNSVMKGQGSLGFDLEESDLILAIGADLLESWGTAVRNQRIFGNRQPEIIFAGPFQTNTSAVAGTWLPIKPEAHGHFALSLAASLLRNNQVADLRLQGFSQLKAFLLRRYAPDAAQAKTGLTAETIDATARKLLRARKPVVTPGSTSGAGEPGLTFFAAHCLNLLLGRFNASGGVTCIPSPPRVVRSAMDQQTLRNRDLGSYCLDLAQGKRPLPKVLLIHEANPIYALPELNRIWDRIPMKVSFSTFMDETAAASDLLLPAPHFMERFDDAFTPFGSGQANYSVAGPVTDPVGNARSTPDIMLKVAQALKIDLGPESFEALLKDKVSLLGASWTPMIKGRCWTDPTRIRPDTLQLWNTAIKDMLDAAQKGGGEPRPLSLATNRQVKMGTPQTAIPPFGLKTMLEQELPNSTTPIRLNSKTGQRLGLKRNDAVRLTSSQGACTGRIQLDEGVMTDVIVAPLGLGHTSFDAFSRDKGDNVSRLLVLKQEPGTQLTSWSGTRLNIEKI